MARRTEIRVRWVVAVAVIALAAWGVSQYGGNLVRQYEYDEEIYLDVNGSAIVNVNASVASLVSLHGLALDTNPAATIDRDYLRKMYGSAVTRVTRVAPWRRAGRRFVQVRIEVDDITKLSQSPLFAWSTYQIERRPEELIYRQHMGGAPVNPITNPSWDGSELVSVRMHLPSRIRFHNAGADNLKRGNILVWEQTLTDRQAGKPIDIEVRIERTSILYSTLLLFAVSGGLALLVMAGILYWLVTRARGRVKKA